MGALYLAGLLWSLLGADGWGLNRLTVRVYVAFAPVAPAGARPEDYGTALNMLLFVPFGWLLRRATRSPAWVVALLALLVSGGAELVQLEFLDRQAEVVDVVANGAGALVGALLAGRPPDEPVRDPVAGPPARR
ncbi:MAG: VanZ family protein [Nocardioides sp.]